MKSLARADRKNVSPQNLSLNSHTKQKRENDRKGRFLFFGRNATFAKGETGGGLQKANIEAWNLTKNEKRLDLCETSPLFWSE